MSKTKLVIAIVVTVYLLLVFLDEFALVGGLAQRLAVPLLLALLDAMGAGLCVLSSDVPENREAIADAGFTFRQGDVEDLADRLRFLIANPRVRKAAGLAARRRITDHYQWSKIAAEIEQVYFDTIGEELKPPSVKKPSGRVEAQASPRERKAG